MSDQEKIDLIIAGIVLAKTQDSGDPFFHLPINFLNRLKEIDSNEIKAILKNLESKDGILKLESSNFPKANKKIVPSSDDIYFDLKILPAFDNWYSNYLLAKGRRLL